MTDSATSTGRLTGVDVARAVALLGMVTVHFGPGRDVGEGWTAFLYHSFYGKASVLFALVAGVGVGLMTSRGTPGEVRARLVYRAAWLVPLGLWLQSLEHPVAVILQYYGVFFLGAIPFVGRRRPTLVVGTTVTLLCGSAIVLWAYVRHEDWMLRAGGDTPLGATGDIVLGGYYPAVTWIPVVVFGMWLSTCDLRATRTRWTMVLVGGATLAATRLASVWLVGVLDVTPERGTWAYALSETGHSEMPLAIAGAVGFGVAVLGVSLLLADRVHLAVVPLASLGRLALTVYVGHLLVFDRWPDLFPADTIAEGATHVAWFGVVTAVGATLWLLALPRGPLEAVVRWPWQLGLGWWRRRRPSTA